MVSRQYPFADHHGNYSFVAGAIMSFSLDIPAIFDYAQSIMDLLASYDVANVAINLVGVLAAGAMALLSYIAISVRD